MRSKGCIGCKYNEGECLLKYDIELTDGCPCKECLIKMMCSDMCRLRGRTYNTLDSYIKYDLRNIHRKNTSYQRRHYRK